MFQAELASPSILVWPDWQQLTTNEAGRDSGCSVSCTSVGLSYAWDRRGLLCVSSGFCDAVVVSRLLAPASAVFAPCWPASCKLSFRRAPARIYMLQAKLCRWTQKHHESTQFGHGSAQTYTCRVGQCLLAVLLLRGLRALTCRGLSRAT